MSSGSPDQPEQLDEGTLAWLAAAAEELEALIGYGLKFGPALDLALGEFLTAAQWPERERFRRLLTQRGLDDFNLDEMWQDMPRSSWEQATPTPDRIVLSLQALQQMPKATPLLGSCMAIVRRAYELYSSDIDNPVVRSGDPALLAAAGGDALLLLCAREVLDQHRPDPLGGGSGGLADGWGRMLNDAAMPYFRDVVTVDDYLRAQAKIIADDRKIYGQSRAISRLSSSGGTMIQPAQATARPRRAELFVIMPFEQTWSAGTYAFIRRAVGKLALPAGQVHLYRADEITTPGQISQQVKDAITSAHVVIADITGVNPNVMWELGYADGQGKSIVILNQDPGSSPFDMRDRRQVGYHTSPTDSDETILAQHLEAALRTANPADAP